MIILTGGGTGGHLSIIKSLKIELKKQNESLIYIGSKYGQDFQWFGDDLDFDKRYFLKIKGFSGRGIWNKVLFLFSLVFHLGFLAFVFWKYKVSKVVGVGGYSSAPASLLAVLLTKKLYLHEQNAVDGGVNKYLKKYAYKYFNSFKLDYPYPVNDEFFLHSRIRGKVNVILFLGGSNGANFINELAMSMALKLENKNIKIIHQSGARDFDKIKEFYAKNNIKAEIYSFSKDLPKLMEKADFCISRAGASTTFELLANSMPTLFVPFPYAIYDHQYSNALYFYEKDLCFLKRENDLENDYIFKLLDGDYRYLSENLKSIIKKDGAVIIAKEVLDK